MMFVKTLRIACICVIAVTFVFSCCACNTADTVTESENRQGSMEADYSAPATKPPEESTHNSADDTDEISPISWSFADGELVVLSAEHWDFNSVYPWESIRESITVVIIQDGVTEIGEAAFARCPNLEMVMIADSVKCIGSYAFYNCELLETVALGNGVTEIADCAFTNCRTLSSVLGGANVEMVEQHAFDVVSSSSSYEYWPSDWLKNLANENGLAILGKCVVDFIDYDYQENAVRIPEGILGIGANAFSGGNFESVSLPSSLKRIGDSAFESCNDLSGIAFPDNLLTIGDNAFYLCTSLGMFDGMYIPASVREIGSAAFYGCERLANVSGGENIAAVGESAFVGTPWVTRYDIDGRQVEFVVLGKVLIYYNGKDENVVIPDGIERVAGFTSSAEVDIETITIPASVTYIDVSSVTLSVSEFIVGDGNKRYVSKDGVLFSKDMTELIRFPVGNSADKYIVPSSVKKIGDYAFSRCEKLIEIGLPEGLTQIGESAFRYCRALVRIEIPNDVECIGTAAFMGCQGLMSVTVPQKITHISSSLFQGCELLEQVNIPDDVKNIAKNAFRGCSALDEITLGKNLVVIGDYAFLGCSFSTVTIPAQVCYVPASAFDECTFLESIEVDGGNLKYSSIDGCLYNIEASSLIRVPAGKKGECIISEGVKKVSASALADCEYLTELTFPESVISIDVDALSSCYGLVEISVASENQAYSSLYGVLYSKDMSVLIRCPKGVSGAYSIPETVRCISKSAFQSCDDIEEIRLTNKLEVIEERAFSNCDALSDIFFDGNEDEWNELLGSVGRGNSPLAEATVHHITSENE